MMATFYNFKQKKKQQREKYPLHLKYWLNDYYMISKKVAMENSYDVHWLTEQLLSCCVYVSAFKTYKDLDYGGSCTTQ